MTRDELIAATRQLIDEGARLQASPSLPDSAIEEPAPPPPGGETAPGAAQLGYEQGTLDL